jgi:CheY-like chemotaxis protein
VAAPDLAGLPVLIVDDNLTNRRILTELCRSWDMRPTAVDDATAALAEMRRATGTGQPYRLAVLDYMMPEMDGLELARRIGAEPDCGDPVLLMVSSAGPAGAAGWREAGIRRYLTKPIIGSELRDAILEALGGKPPAEPARDGILSLRGEGPADLRILLAEDGVVNQTVAKGLLERMGHSVDVVDDGRLAVEAVAGGGYDLVMMDLQMPRMDGFEATDEIRRREADTGRRLPIVALTAAAMKGDRERCLAAGMDGYVSKPIDIAELARTIASVVSPAADRARVAAGAPFDRAGPPADVVDWSAAAHRIPGGERGLRETAALLLEECPRLLDEIRDAQSRGDAERLRRGAHTLKGSADLFGAAAVTAAATTIERLASEGEIAGARRELPRLETEVERLQAAIRSSLSPA